MAPHRCFHFICVTKLPTGAVCNRGFHNRSGLTQHINVQHRKFAPKEPSTPPHSPEPSPPPDDLDIENVYDFYEGEEHGEQARNPEGNIVKHPILDGMSNSCSLSNDHNNTETQEHRVIRMVLTYHRALLHLNIPPIPLITRPTKTVPISNLQTSSSPKTRCQEPRSMSSLTSGLQSMKIPHSQITKIFTARLIRRPWVMLHGVPSRSPILVLYQKGMMYLPGCSPNMKFGIVTPVSYSTSSLEIVILMVGFITHLSKRQTRTERGVGKTSCQVIGYGNKQ